MDYRPSPATRRLIDTITTDWINTLEFCDKIPIEEFVDRMDISKEQIGELTAYFGMALTQLMTVLRLEYAMHLVIGNRLSIQAASKLAGYKDDSNFRKLFIARYGKSPKDLLEEHVSIPNLSDYFGMMWNTISSDKAEVINHFTGNLKKRHIRLYLTKEYFPLLNLRPLTEDDFRKANIKKINYHKY